MRLKLKFKVLSISFIVVLSTLLASCGSNSVSSSYDEPLNTPNKKSLYPIIASTGNSEFNGNESEFNLDPIGFPRPLPMAPMALDFENSGFYNPGQTKSVLSPYTYNTTNANINNLNYTNLNMLYAYGLLPVFSGKTTPVTGVNTGDLIQAQGKSYKLNLAKVQYNPGANAFQGNGISILQIDGKADFSKHTDVYAHEPLELNIQDLLHLQSNYPKLSAEENHGFRVGSIIIGKRNPQSSGLVPDVNFYYTQLPVELSNLGEVFIASYCTVYPQIINNSYSIPYEKSNNSLFHNLLSNLSELSSQTNDNAPLLVFSAGNTNLDKLRVTDSEYVEHLLNLSAFGHYLDKDSFLYHLLQDNAIKKDLIVVAGVYYDPNKEFKIKNSAWYIENLVPQAEQERVKRQAKFNDLVLDVKKYKEFDAKNVISALGSYKCGLAMYDCLSASYIYYQQAYTNEMDYLKHINFGTSFSAPVVSAIAAMVKQQFPWMTASNLKTTLLTTATDLGKPGVDPIFGWGLVNASKALRGPAQFAFGDFIVDLSHRIYRVQSTINEVKPYASDNVDFNNLINQNNSFNSYFLNSISGVGGLQVNGGANDYLYLVAPNTYTGNTLVNTGNLVLTIPYNLGINFIQNNSSKQRAILTSNVSINPQGNFYAIDATVSKNIYSRGRVLLKNAIIGGDFEQTESGTLYLDSSSNTNEIKGKVTLGGKLELLGTSSASNLETHHVLLQTNKGLYGSLSFNANAYNTALLKYQLFYSQSQLVLTRSIKSTSAIVKTLADNSTLKDQYNLRTGAKQIAQILSVSSSTSSDNQDSSSTYSLSTLSSHSSALTLAGAAIVTMSNDQLQKLFYRNANTVYSDARYVAQTSHNQDLNSFMERVGNRFSTLDSKLNGFLNYRLASTDWSNSQTTNIDGKLQTSTYSGGFYKQVDQVNLGVGYFYNRLTWHEQVHLRTPSTNQEQTVDLGQSQIKAHTLAFNVGYTTDDSFYNATIFGNLNSNQVTRSSLYTNDQTSKFNTYGIGILGGFGKQILDWGSNGGLVFTYNLNWQYHYQSQFKEYAQLSTDHATSLAQSQVHKQQSAQLSLNANTKTTWDVYSTTGLKLYKGFTFNQVHNYVYTQVNIGQYLFTPTYSLDVHQSTDTTTAEVTFSNKTLVSFTAGYGFVRKAWGFNLSSSYQYSANWHHYQVQAGISYGF